MVDFKFQLNRQGVRGQRGEKGDKGFSPLITEKTNTKEEYVLHIQNETDDTSFDTPNLKEGLVPEDMGGTYVRLNRETGNQYYGEIDEATETTKGAVKLEPDETILTPTSETSVITAEQAVQNYTKKTETQDLQNIVTVNSEDIDKLQDMEYVSSIGVRGSDLTVQKSKNGVITTNATIPLPTGTGDVTAAGNNRFTGDNTFTGKVNIADLRSDDIQTTGNKKYLTELDVDNQTIQVVNGKLHANLDELGNEVNDLAGRVTGCESNILTMKTSIGMKQTKLTAGSNITLTDLSNGTVRIDATGGGGTGDIPIATTTTAGKVKPDGTTITITDDGTISAVGGGGSTPANMMTTDTNQTIDGAIVKNFSTNWAIRNDSGLYGSFVATNVYIGNSGGSLNSPNIKSKSSQPLYILSNDNGFTTDKGLEITKDTLRFINSSGVATDLLAGNIPTVIDGGDSTTV